MSSKPAPETLHGPGKSSVTVHHHGAHITSWTDHVGREMIYTSPLAVYNGEKAIRGGVPICFPQFGKRGPLPQHGFARNMPWAVGPRTSGTCLHFVLHSTERTMASQWPYKFRVDYTVVLESDGNKLVITMDVTNLEDDRPFTFTTALHSYFTVDHAAKASIPQLDTIEYIDAIDPSTTAHKVQNGPTNFPGEVDRVYIDTPQSLSLMVGNKEAITVTKHNLPEAVVWNPYVERARAMADLPDDAWMDFVCIEPGRIEQPATVDPGQVWSCKCELSSSS